MLPQAVPFAPPAPIAPVNSPAAQSRSTGQLILLAVVCGLLFSLVPMGVAAMYIWNRESHSAVPVQPSSIERSDRPESVAADEPAKVKSPLAVATELLAAGGVAGNSPAAPPAPAEVIETGLPGYSTFKPVKVAGELEPVAGASKRTVDLADLIETVESSVVRINVSGPDGGALGSGFVASADGTIITNHHVIEGAGSAEVIFKDGRKARVRGVRADLANKDVAVLSIEPVDRPLIPLKIATQLPRKGEQVVAFGAPLGFSFTASDGLISAIRNGSELNGEFRSLGFNLDYDSHVTWLQTTAPISRGNSGGPLVNMRGEVVGLNTLSIPELGQNLNFAVSGIDLQKGLDGAADKPQPLVPSARAPQRGNGPGGGPGPGGGGPGRFGPARGGRREPVDGLNTPAGKRLLAGLQQVAVAVIVSPADPLGTPREPRFTSNLILGQCVQSLRSAGLQVAEQDSPEAALLLVRAELQNHTNTSYTCQLNYTLLERDAAANGPPVRTWNLEHEVMFDSRYMTQVKRIPTDVKGAVHSLATAVHDARQRGGKPTPPAPAGVSPAERIPRPAPAGQPRPGPGD
jgi:S1-C subfamily serine protease